MAQFPVSTSSEQSIYAALELSKNSWLLAIQFPDRDSPSLYPIRGGNADGLMAKLDVARDRVARVTGQTPKVTLCYEADYDGFWLARFLEQRGIDCRVMEPASLQVNRRERRVKTDRIDVENLLHTLIAWCRGERHVCSIVVIPSVEEEDLRRSHRERGRLVRERTAHVNRIKGLLFGQGIRGINVMKNYKTLVPAELATGDGRPLPERLGREITREIERLALVQEQLVEVEHERDQAPTPCAATERKRHDLLRLNGIGPTFSAILAREVYYRRFANRRQVASYIGLPIGNHPAHDAAAEDVEQDIEVEGRPAFGPPEPGDIPGPGLVGARGHQLGLGVAGMTALIAPLSHRLVRGQDPVHRALGAQILAFIEQRRDDLGR